MRCKHALVDCVVVASYLMSDSIVQNDLPVTKHLFALDNRVISHRINRAKLIYAM